MENSEETESRQSSAEPPGSSCINYISTRGQAKPASFSEVLLSVTAPDNGLYLPSEYPDISSSVADFADMPYTDIAFRVIRPFIESALSDETLKELIGKSYRHFRHEDCLEMVDMGNYYILELFHGPTLAFKDYPLQLLGNLFYHFLEVHDQRLNLLGATSGDTGSAAIYGVKGKSRMNIFMLFPLDGISPVQKLQMTTIREANVFNIGISGSFDDGQRVVKQIFSDHEFCRKYNIGAVNSINWARVMAQIVYYFYAGSRFIKMNPGEPLVFSVPTGNFGNIFAGYAAKQMGLPISKLICATNSNDILSQAINTGVYKQSSVIPTISPSMDIQVSSNFERLLFEASGRDGNVIRDYYAQFEKNGEYTIEPKALQEINSLFSSISVTEQETIDTIKKVNRRRGYLLDPHTAVGVAAALNSYSGSFISLATASFAKFRSVYDDIGIDVELPAEIEKLNTLNSSFRKLDPTVSKIKEFIINSL